MYLFFGLGIAAGQPISFLPAVNYPTGSSSGALDVAIGDLNGDGKKDVAIADFYQQAIQIRYGNGNGTFGAPTLLMVGANPVSVEIADLNADGVNDLAVSRQSGLVVVLIGSGGGAFSLPVTYAAGAQAGAILVGDLNKDNRPDLVTTNTGSQTISVLLNAGGGVFGAATQFPTGPGNGPIALAMGDFNGDTSMDLAVPIFFSNAVGVLLGDGMGGFGAASYFPTNGTSPQSVAAGDFNQDGKLDLVVANTGANSLAFLSGLGTGAFGPTVTYSTGVNSGPVSLAVGDLNNDGKADLAVSNWIGASLGVMQGNGMGSFSLAGTYPTGVYDTRQLALGDLNGDGKLDAAAVSFGGEVVSAWINNSGPPPDATPPVITPSLSMPANAAGWHRMDVTVSWAVSDAESGISGSTGCGVTVVSLETTPAGVTMTCQATNGAGLSSSQQVTVRLDKTPPALTSTRTPAPNGAGWNNGDVTVGFTCVDALSGLVNYVPGGTVFSGEGANQQTSFACGDAAGNVSAATVSGINIDKTAPALMSTRTPAPNGAGWNNGDVTVGFSCVDALSGLVNYAPGGTVFSGEGANQQTSFACGDAAGNVSGATVGGINIDKTRPVAGTVLLTPAAVAIGVTAQFSASATDTGGSGLAKLDYNVDGGSSALLGSLSGAAGSAAATVGPFGLTGLHEYCGIPQDVAGNVGEALCTLLAVFDPTGGFVTGAGQIHSPLGAFPGNPGLQGRAHFGFNAKYKPGAQVPDGRASFRVQIADFRFESTSYDWLVVAGARAQFKGVGTINGAGSYQFLLTAIDGKAPGGGGLDRFRIKIQGPGGIVYDNQMGAGDQAEPTTAITVGSITVHK